MLDVVGNRSVTLKSARLSYFYAKTASGSQIRRLTFIKMSNFCRKITKLTFKHSNKHKITEMWVCRCYSKSVSKWCKWIALQDGTCGLPAIFWHRINFPRRCSPLEPPEHDFRCLMALSTIRGHNSIEQLTLLFESFETGLSCLIASCRVKSFTTSDRLGFQRVRSCLEKNLKNQLRFIRVPKTNLSERSWSGVSV
jgi:hypothetical protein